MIDVINEKNMQRNSSMIQGEADIYGFFFLVDSATIYRT